MLRVWGIVKKNNKILRDMVAEYEGEEVEEVDMLKHCLSKICYEFDLQRPMWLPKNQKEYEDYRRVVLTEDNFIETIDFDNLELEILDDKL